MSDDVKAFVRGAEWATMRYLPTGPEGFYTEAETEAMRLYPANPEPRVCTCPPHAEWVTYTCAKCGGSAPPFSSLESVGHATMRANMAMRRSLGAALSAGNVAPDVACDVMCGDEWRSEGGDWPL
jgi:hypothetical protein